LVALGVLRHWRENSRNFPAATPCPSALYSWAHDEKIYKFWPVQLQAFMAGYPFEFGRRSRWDILGLLIVAVFAVLSLPGLSAPACALAGGKGRRFGKDSRTQAALPRGLFFST